MDVKKRKNLFSGLFRAVLRPAVSALLVVALSATMALAEPFAYITNLGNSNVSVIDTASNTVVATVPVGSLPSGVAVTPDGAFVYVANQGTTMSRSSPPQPTR